MQRAHKLGSVEVHFLARGLFTTKHGFLVVEKLNELFEFVVFVECGQDEGYLKDKRHSLRRCQEQARRLKQARIVLHLMLV
mmetsp:Transcript_4726/g.6227  ORF Transcript_4726/g.6227 Transcript_4726/m.6227 type:complete len:81 (-) Transcript_4726:1077-1319(-)